MCWWRWRPVQARQLERWQPSPRLELALVQATSLVLESLAWRRQVRRPVWLQPV